MPYLEQIALLCTVSRDMMEVRLFVAGRNLDTSSSTDSSCSVTSITGMIEQSRKLFRQDIVIISGSVCSLR